MQTKLYTIRDLVAGEAGPLINAVNDGVAVRQCCQLLHSVSVVDVNDYSLICLGVYDTVEMTIKSEYYEIEFQSFYALYSVKLEELKARETFISEVK